MSLHLCLFLVGQLTKRHLTRWEPLCVHKMFPNSVTTQFPFVPSKHILVTFQDLLELLSLLLIQVMIDSNLLVDLFPPCAHFMIVRQFQLLTAIVVKATVLCLMNLQQYENFYTTCRFKDAMFSFLCIRNPLKPINIIIYIYDLFFHKIINLPL